MQKLPQKQPQGIAAQVLFALLGEEQSEIPNTGVEALLTKFEIVFQEPKGLPPSRTHNHPIPLKPRVEPPNSRPYRYGKENKATDALSRREDYLHAIATLHALSSVATNWLTLVQ